MRILHTADWHLGKTLDGRSRLDEQAAFLEDFARMAQSEDVDLVIVAGDVFDGVNPPARAETLFYDALKRISDGGRRLTLIVAGNHDNPERLMASGPLAMEHGILMAGLPATAIPVGAYGRHRVVASGAGYVEIEINGERAVILTVAYPSEKRLGEALYLDGEEEEARAQTYDNRVKALFETLQTHFRDDTINIAVSHLFVTGSEPGGSERGIQLGGSYLVSASSLPERAQYVALGHIHRPQAVHGTHGRARYAGAPMPYDKGEAGMGKRCCVIDVQAGGEAVVRELPLPVYKPIERWRCAGVEAALETCRAHAGESSYVYLEIETDRALLAEEMKQMRALKDDIVEIMPVGERAPGQVAARPAGERDFETLFRDFFRQATGRAPEAEMVRLLLDVNSEEETL